MRGRRGERGLVVVFALVLMGAVAMIATAFAVLVRTEKKAARNSCLASQAELGALSGLEHAIRAIRIANEVYSLVSCPDGALAPSVVTPSTGAGEILSGWHRYFEEDDSPKGVLLSDAEKWVWHYKDQRYAPEHVPPPDITHDMYGRVHGPSVDEAALPEWSVRVGPPLTQASCAFNYAVCVVDLDGKLHSLPVRWDLNASLWPLQPEDEADLSAIVKAWAQQSDPSPPFPAFTNEEVDALVGLGLAPDVVCRSVREIAGLALPKPSSPTSDELDEWRQKTCAVEAYMTPYPVGPGRSSVNVNTTRLETIEAAICEVPSLKSAAGRALLVADFIYSRRPYASRAEFEDTLFLATEGESGDDGFVALNRNDGNDEFLTEKEFNDILNSTVSHAVLEVVIWPDVATEADGTLAGVGEVRIPVALNENITVTLRSTNPSEVTDPGVVVIAAGSRTVTFDITVQDNGDADGDRPVTIVATGSGYFPGSDMLYVVDDEETDALTVTIAAASATEGDGVLAGTVNLPGIGVAGDLVVDLRSTDTTEATVPASIVILDGNVSATFDVTIRRDGLEDGDQMLSIVASASGYESGWEEFEVESNSEKYAELDDSVYDEPGKEGYYSFDGWEPYDGPNGPSGPSQTGGDCTVSDRDLTWGCEFKFTSRYFHTYSVGLVREVDPLSGLVTDRVLARRKLHAVYDAEDDRVLWFRWNVTERGNIGDFSP